MPKRLDNTGDDPGPLLKHFKVDNEKEEYICQVEMKTMIEGTEEVEVRICNRPISRTKSDKVNDMGTRAFNLKRHLYRCHPDLKQVSL